MQRAEESGSGAAELLLRESDKLELYSRSRDGAMLALGIAFVLLQRLVIPVGGAQIPANLVLVISYLAIGLLSGRIVAVPSRLAIWLTFVGLSTLSTMVSDSRSSVLSLAQVLVYWSVLSTQGLDSRGARRLLTGVVGATAGAAAFALVQYIASSAAGVFLDPLSGLSERLLVQGYNTTYGVDLLGGWEKSNGGVFLEPSFLSLMSALSIVFVMQRVVFDSLGWKTRTAVVLLLATGLLTSTALSGLLVLPLILLSVLRDLRSGLLLAGVLAIVWATVQVLPVTQAYLLRLGSTGSNEARLVRPYTELLPVGLENRPLLGFGPGAADLTASALSGGQWVAEVTAPTVVKLLFEYGGLGGGMLLLLLLIVAVGSPLPAISKIALLVALVVPTNGLVNPLITPIVLIALSHGRNVGKNGTRRRGRLGDRRPSTLEGVKT